MDTYSIIVMAHKGNIIHIHYRCLRKHRPIRRVHASAHPSASSHPSEEFRSPPHPTKRSFHHQWSCFCPGIPHWRAIVSRIGFGSQVVEGGASSGVTVTPAAVSITVSVGWRALRIWPPNLRYKLTHTRASHVGTRADTFTSWRGWWECEEMGKVALWR